MKMPSFLSWRNLLWTFPVIVLFGIGPMLVGWAAEEAGYALGCVVNDGGPSPCLLWGINIKAGLKVAFDFGWAVIVTLPAAAVAYGIWGIGFWWLVIAALRRRVSRR